MSLGRRELKAWLRRSVMKSSTLASELGISRAYMSQILSGERRPGLDLLVRIHDRTGIAPRSWAAFSMSATDHPHISETISA
jgi:transcriptional regulator with XRE-family HTH domain